MLEANSEPRTARAIGIVQRVQAVTPHMQRITLGGYEIVEFLGVDGGDEAATCISSAASA